MSRKIMNIRKISPHMMFAPDINDTINVMRQWRPAVLKSFNEIGHLLQVAGGLDYEPILVGRLWWDDGQMGNPNDFNRMVAYATTGGSFNPQKAVDLWVSKFNFAQYGGRANLFFESYNEIGLQVEYMAFEAARTRTMFERYGLRSCVLNPAVGWTDANYWRAAANVGLLDAVRQTGSLLGTHGYAGLWLGLWHGDAQATAANDMRLAKSPLEYVREAKIYPAEMPGSWLAFRVVRDYYNLNAMGYGDLKFVLTEFGFDEAGLATYKHYTGGKSVNGWRDWVPHWQANGFLENGKTPERFYAEQLVWAEKQFQAYPFVAGATVFTYGADPASQWNRTFAWA
jgi:hypothetical protein